MKIFDHFNQASICPLCKKNRDGKAVLIPMDDTEDDGICEATQVHLDCISLRWMNTGKNKLIYQLIKKDGK